MPLAGLYSRPVMSSRGVWIALGLVVVALVGLAYWLSQPAREGPAPASELGLGWLPGEAVLVASVHASELRQQSWLIAVVAQAAPVAPEADYREFVAATGFDYARDLDRLWLGIVPAGSGTELVGIAQGRFAQERIVAYARQQGARRVSLGGVAAYVRERTQPRERFAFAFLDEDHLAFAETIVGVKKILACVRRAAPSVTSAAGRRAHLERFGAGLQVWVVGADPERWLPPGRERWREIAAQLAGVAVGVRVTAEGIELVAEGETHEPAQAERMKLVLETYGLVGQVVLGRRTDPASGALREALSAARVEQEGNLLTLRARVSRAAVAALLGVPRVRESSPPAATPQPDKQ